MSAKQRPMPGGPALRREVTDRLTRARGTLAIVSAQVERGRVRRTPEGRFVYERLTADELLDRLSTLSTVVDTLHEAQQALRVLADETKLWERAQHARPSSS